MSSRPAKLARRPNYKPERRPARLKGVLYKLAPIGCPDASESEVSKAVFALAWKAGFVVGRGSGYEPLKDKYTLIGKSRTTGKAQDVELEGHAVAETIYTFRLLNGGRADRTESRRALGAM